MEGPSLVILREEMQQFIGQKIVHVSGNSKIDQTRLHDQVLIDVKTFGKEFLLCFAWFTLRTHFLLFGSYRINEAKDMAPRLSLNFANWVLNMYICSIRYIDQPLDEIYDQWVDVMSPSRDEKKVLKLVQKQPDSMVSDVLLDQKIFAWVWNIIKNEVLFRLSIHPESLVWKLSLKQQKMLVKEAHIYSWDFYTRKKAYVLRKHYQIYTKRSCPTCGAILVKRKVWKTNRRTFFCQHCQILYL